MLLKPRPSFILLLLLCAAFTTGCINSYSSSSHPGDYDLDIELPEYDEVEPETDTGDVEGENTSEGELSETEATENTEAADIESESDGELEGGELEEATESEENADSADSDEIESEVTETAEE